MEKSRLRAHAITIVLSTCISLLITAFTVRACLDTKFKFNFSPASILCGKSPLAIPAAFRRLGTSDMTVVSMIPERKESIQEGTGADKLIDGSEKTLAAPGNNKIDYAINLFDTYEIKQVVISWGDYGISRNYINTWSLESSNDGSIWKAIAGGNSPKDNKTIVNERVQTAHLRLRAEAEKDWIGTYEMEIIAKVLQ